MLIAFLDLPGFTILVKECPGLAHQNFDRFNEIWRTMCSDASMSAKGDSDFVCKGSSLQHQVIFLVSAIQFLLHLKMIKLNNLFLNYVNL